MVNDMSEREVPQLHVSIDGDVLENLNLSVPAAPQGPCTKVIPVQDASIKKLFATLWPRTTGEYTIYATRFTGSMTNGVFKVWKEDTDTCNSDGAVILRVQMDCCDHVIDRDTEEMIFRVFSDSGIGPRYLLQFDNGRIEEFLHGYAALQGREEMKHVMPFIAKTLAQFHAKATDVVFKKNKYDQIPTLRNRLHSWCMYIQERLPSGPQHDWIQEFSSKTLSCMDALFPPSDLEALLHGDLQCGNIMMRKSQSSEPSIRLIDFDYVGFGDIGWDIGNHFCEYAADYTSNSQRALFRWDLIPTENEKRLFIDAYVRELAELGDSSLNRRVCASSRNAANSLRENLLQQSQRYMYVSHVYYCAWALVIHVASKPMDDDAFDYLGYAYDRYLQVQKKAEYAM